MEANPSQIQQTPIPEQKPNTIKQVIIGVVFGLLLAGAWWYLLNLSQLVINSIFGEELLTTYYLLLTILVMHGVFLTLIGLGSLLIKNKLIRILAILLPALVILAWAYSSTPLQQAAFLAAIAVLSSLLLSSSVIADSKVFFNFSLGRILLPNSTYLFMGIAGMIVLPLYFYLSVNQNLIPKMIETKLIGPTVDRFIKTEFSKNSVLSPELTDELREGLATDIENLPFDIPSLGLPDLPNLDASEIIPKEQIKQQVTDQVNQYLNPVLPYLPIIIPLFAFLTIFQITSLLKPLLFIIPWLVFKLLLMFRVAKITTRLEPVEVLEV